jgi:hypothetical protein
MTGEERDLPPPPAPDAGDPLHLPSAPDRASFDTFRFQKGSYPFRGRRFLCTRFLLGLANDQILDQFNNFSRLDEAGKDVSCHRTCTPEGVLHLVTSTSRQNMLPSEYAIRHRRSYARTG